MTRTRFPEYVLLATLAIGCAAPPDVDGDVDMPAAPGPTETKQQAIFGGALDPVSGPNIVRNYADCAGRVQTAIWWCFTGQGEVHNAACPLGDSSFVAVGGSAWTMGGEGFPGAFIVDGFVPSSNRDSFQAASKSHVQSNSHLLVVMVIGLKITGVSRDQLLANIRDDVQTSFVASGQPFENLNVPSGRLLLGGTAFVHWFQGVTPGQLMVGSWGANFSGNWQASSIQHIQADSLKLTLKLTSIAPSIAGINLQGFDASNAVSSSSGLGEARVTIGRFAPTAIGAWATFNGAGRHLVRVSPDFEDSRPRDFLVQSKDHMQADGGTTFINVVGIGERLTVPVPCRNPSTF
jgi:hypothetical protein